MAEMLAPLARRLIVAAVVSAVAAGCGGQTRALEDGQYYGKLVSVDAAQRRLAFAPACIDRSGRWRSVATSDDKPVTLAIAAHADLEIYFRPSGNVAAGHGQTTDLRQLADVVAHGQLPDFRPTWFISVRDGTAVSVTEDSGLRASDEANKPSLACVTNAARVLTAPQVSWRKLAKLIQSCRAKRVDQTHNRLVTVTLRDQSQVSTREPHIDAVIPIVNRAMQKCGPMTFATE